MRGILLLPMADPPLPTPGCGPRLLLAWARGWMPAAPGPVGTARVTAGWAAYRKVASRATEGQLWDALSGFITFTRLATGRGHVERLHDRAPVSRATARLVQLLLLLLLASHLLRNWQSWQVRWLTEPSFIGPVLAGAQGFSASVPSCYDGDTCYVEDLRYGGAVLPPALPVCEGKAGRD